MLNKTQRERILKYLKENKGSPQALTQVLNNCGTNTHKIEDEDYEFFKSQKNIIIKREGNITRLEWVE